MDLFAIILFLGMYYLKPQEWWPLFRSLHPAQLTMFMGIWGLYNRQKTVRLKDLFRTPHDYALILFFAWVVLTSGHAYNTFKLVFNLLVFYAVIVQTLNSVRRMETFLTWWCVFLLVVAALAVLSEYGFDPFGSYNLTHWKMKDRLSLNLSIFNNPNALAHSVVPVIPMLYFLMLWKRPLLMKNAAVGFMLLPLYCIYLTLSKGAFLSGFATVLATLIFGRPKAVQAAILIFAVVVGFGALYTLPRMSELNKSKSDEAIQGRIAAYTYGYKCVTTLWAGIGYGNWMESFYKQSRRYKVVKEPRHLSHGRIVVVRKLVPERYYKAAHGSFNNMGSELGFTGLALFFGMVWCSLRTLFTAKTETVEEERVRRILAVLMVSYLVSSWMVDFGYRPTFFMFTAATAALHRHLKGIHRQQDEEIALEAIEKSPIWKRRQTRSTIIPPASLADLSNVPPLAPALGDIAPAANQAITEIPSLPLAPAVLLETSRIPTTSDLELLPPAKIASPAKPHPLARFVKLPPAKNETGLKSFWKALISDESPLYGSILWNRLGIVDLVGSLALTIAAVKFWGHIIHTM